MNTAKAQELTEVLAKLQTEMPHAIPSEGSVDARIFCVGEVVNFHEQDEKKLLVGTIGELFRSLIEEHSGVPFADWYFANIVKTHIPDNKDPSVEELEQHRKYLDAEIEIVSPELIITLGKFSLQKFLPGTTIVKVHGVLHKIYYPGGLGRTGAPTTVYVLPLFHPAAVMRFAQKKQALIDSLHNIPAILAWIKKDRATEQAKKPPKPEKLTFLQQEFAKTDKTLTQAKITVIGSEF